jgi:HK97 family phage prohead protease
MSKLNNTIEHRLFTTELRADTPDSPKLSGYAAVFNVITDLGRFKEQIMAGAFKRSIAEKQDVRALFNHNPDHVLGRTKNNSLTLSEDNTGLKFNVDPPNTSTGKNVYTLVQRGDVDQCSFGFIVRDEEVTYDDDGNATRSIKDVDLFDISIVTYPAYESTSVEARSRDAAAQAYKKRDDVDDGGPMSKKDEEECQCPCVACADDRCSDCASHIQDCDDPNCNHDPDDFDPEINSRVMNIETAKTHLAQLE